MSQTPCEYIVWNGLPIIRKEIAFRLVRDYNLSKTETARKLGITPAAVSLYLSGKRAKVHITDKEVCKEIDISVKKIIQQKDIRINSEICRLCNILRIKKIF